MPMPGSIDAEELTQIIVTLYEVEGRSREDGEARAEEIFKLFDEVRRHQSGGWSLETPNTGRGRGD